MAIGHQSHTIKPKLNNTGSAPLTWVFWLSSELLEA